MEYEIVNLRLFYEAYDFGILTDVKFIFFVFILYDTWCIFSSHHLVQVKNNKNAITEIQQSPAIPADVQDSLNQLTRDVQDLKTRVQDLERAELTLPPDLQNRVRKGSIIMLEVVENLWTAISDAICQKNVKKTWICKHA